MTMVNGRILYENGEFFIGEAPEEIYEKANRLILLGQIIETGDPWLMAQAGIPQEEIPLIFERFYRVERLRNSETTGLGLAIARQIVERFGGSLWVQSPSPTAKTTFYISLPCLTKT